MKKNEHRRIKMTKLLLKNSLVELMHSKPMAKITIKELCSNADVNRSTFYLYYTDQFALLKEIEDELLSHLKAHLEKIDTNHGTIPYLESMLFYITENAGIFRTLLCVQESFSFQSTFVEASFINLRQILPLDYPELARPYIYDFLIMGCLSVIKRWINSGFDMSCKDMASLLFQLSDKASK